MKKRLFLWAAATLFLVIPGLRAQYSITPVPPPPSFTFNDLWHFSVSKPGAGGQDLFYVSLRIYGSTHTLLVKSNSATFTLSAGTRYFNLTQLADLQPFSTSYYDAPLLQQAIATGGLFPPGTYQLVYTLYGKQADGAFEPLFENTTEAVVEALWPPMLLSPPDGDTLPTPTPLLTWTPAFSSGYVGPVNYRLNLVELFSGQNAYQAIQSNPLYFSQSNLPVTMLAYPAAAQVLDTGKVYAWQVHADAGGTSLGSSEIWTFRLAVPKKDSASTDTIPLVYMEPEAEYPATFAVLSEKKIPFKFRDCYQQDDHNLIGFALFREGEPDPVITSETCVDCLFATRHTYYVLRLEEENRFTPGFYLLTVFDGKGHTQYLRILYLRS